MSHPARSSETTWPSAARLRRGSKPTWPLLPVTRRTGMLRDLGCILFGDPVAVFASRYIPHPGLVVQIPFHRLAQAGFDCFSGHPAEFTLEFAGVDGVATIVARTILDEGDLVGVGARVLRPQFVQQIAHGVHDLDIGLLVPAADVICLACPAARQHLA